MALPQHATFFCDPRGTAEHPVKFRFPVGWQYLSLPDRETPAAPERLPEPTVFTASPPPEREISVPAIVSGSDGLHGVAIGPGEDHSKQWEMVIPRMVRLPRLPGQSATIGATRQLETPAKPAAYESFDDGPTLATLPESLLSRLVRPVPARWRWSLLSGAAVAVIISVVAMLPAPRTAVKAAPIVPSAQWIREPAIFAAGSHQQRQLVLYRGTEQPSDFRAEFDWAPNRKSFAFIFRCTDRANYQAIRISVASWQPLSIAAEHFTILDGLETAHVRKALPWPSPSAPIHVALEATSFAFRLYMQGEHFDYWTDDRLKKGDVGFYEDRNTLALESVHLAFPDHPALIFDGRLPQLGKTLP